MTIQQRRAERRKLIEASKHNINQLPATQALTARVLLLLVDAIDDLAEGELQIRAVVDGGDGDALNVASHSRGHIR
jgi:hypothetical protein